MNTISGSHEPIRAVLRAKLSSARASISVAAMVTNQASARGRGLIDPTARCYPARVSAGRSVSEKPEHYGAMMRRYRIWMAWTIGPLTAALIVLTVLAAATDFMPWPPLLATTVAAAVAGTFLIALGPRIARQQERERRAQQNQRVR